MKWDRAERRAAWVMLAVIATEGYWCAINLAPHPSHFLRFLGFLPGTRGAAIAWLLACVVAGAYVTQGSRLPSVKEHLLRPSALKFLALLMAVVAAVLEESFSKKLLMDYLSQHAFSRLTQIALSGAAFGIAHGIWGLLARSLAAAAGATLYTGVLGAALAVVYLVAGRSLAPCIVAHFWITFLLEPGLLLGAIRGEMSHLRYRRLE